MTRIDEIRERLDKATPGPWAFASAPAEESDETPADYLAGALTGDGPLFVVWVPSTEGNPGGYVLTAATGDGPHASQDADLIANAPADLAWCLGEIERLQEALAQAWQEGFSAAHDQHVAFEDRHGLAQGITMHNPYTSREN